MRALHIITPVKDAIDSTLETVQAILSSQLKVPFTYTLYNDFSTQENTCRLQQAATQLGFNLVNLSDLTAHPSPNYLLVLQRERHACIDEDAALLIVESDVVVKPDTLQGLWDGACQHPDAGIVAAVTVDEQGRINYPYSFMAGHENEVVDSKRHCSFCCSLLTPTLLRKIDFDDLDGTKNWFDVTISHLALKAGLRNYIHCTLPVLHKPHASRPWKALKYKNPIKYYWLKWTRGYDKI